MIWKDRLIYLNRRIHTIILPRSVRPGFLFADLEGLPVLSIQEGMLGLSVSGGPAGFVPLSVGFVPLSVVLEMHA